jgi:hypothetical protein
MKSLIIFTAFTSSAVASAIQLPNLMDRAIDPATMNPTLFSVLSVLKTGMPTGPNVPMPTGDFIPDWYQNLPGDVKRLLPSFYPVAAAAASATSDAQIVSQVSAVESSVSVASVSSLTSSSLLSASSSSSSSNADDTSSTPSMSQYASAATDTVLASSLVPHSNSALQTATPSAALASLAATPPNSLSTGARFAVKIETLAVVAWLSVGAGFFIFA